MWWIRFTLFLVAVAGCRSFIDNQAADSTYRILSKAQEVGRRQSDLELARAAMPGGIFQLETFALAYPDHRGFKLMHAETLCQYGVSFVFDDWEDADLHGKTDLAADLGARAVRFAVACADANLSLLPLSWRTARAQGGAAWDEVVSKATRAHVPQLLWIATTDAIALAIDPAKHIANLPSTVAALERCIALAPGFHDSDAEILLGTLEAGRSQFLGGSDGERRFETARAQQGRGAFLVDVMYARGSLVAQKDRARFASTLQSVVAADLTAFPARRLANELARRKALRYLAAIDRLFIARSQLPEATDSR